MSVAKRLKRSLLFCLKALVILVLMVGLWYGFRLLQRPARTNRQEQLFPGITYQRMARNQPRPVMIHLVDIDLQQPGLAAFVTPGQATADRTEIPARLTSAFLQEFSMNLAVNGSFFYEFRENTPWDYFPHVGDRVNTVGYSMSDGKAYSEPEKDWRVLCFMPKNEVQILAQSNCGGRAQQALAGNLMLLESGQRSPDLNTVKEDKPYPRLAVGLDPGGKHLKLLLVDGKQKGYSEGLWMEEFVTFLQGLGLDRAVNLDGGGSVTLAVAGKGGPRILNAPIHTHVPMRERPVANHLGFRVSPQTAVRR
ncbi:MAG: phosphodiester glycosidase family protein [Alkalinema sp. RU_4_3]|nr:phosphodiester glycosidase family protein [Alkalinema sp. RU_4_3]